MSFICRKKLTINQNSIDFDFEDKELIISKKLLFLILAFIYILYSSILRTMNNVSKIVKNLFKHLCIFILLSF